MFDNSPSVYDLEPGTLDFDILWFRNPRSLLESGQWNVTIYNNVGKTLYYWNETSLPLKPTIRMTKPARPQ